MAPRERPEHHRKRSTPRPPGSGTEREVERPPVVEKPAQGPIGSGSPILHESPATPHPAYAEIPVIVPTATTRWERSLHHARALLATGLVVAVAAPLIGLAVLRVAPGHVSVRHLLDDLRPATAIEALIALGAAVLAWRRLRRHTSLHRRGAFMLAAWATAAGVALVGSGVSVGYGEVVFDVGLLVLLASILGERSRHA